ncbi:uracil-DNA glycosylase [Abyssibacter profundi]|uniref:Type-5 uracil-DNA glycosylase n=1 Tax=Abyssibacter profundi TaxID=2182787 RepID=A0A363UPP0_9GAMM|nr:uracil-DNA glycosylase [Abyssibacter profundi]PWN57441.1 SPO1 DNA polymerase [Abyssibacter profundi]
MAESFHPDCARCDRLVAFRTQSRIDHPGYFGRAVPSFGPAGAPLLIVGLAPGMHGANATGRPFTGDYAGILLYQTLFDLGLASSPVSEHAEDGLRLIGCRITNAVRCVPPQNKPVGSEIDNCRPYLVEELEAVPPGGVLLALGKIAHDQVIRALGLRVAAYKFAHEAVHALPSGLQLVDSYHCSRYNTNTRRLTPAMFESVMRRARDLRPGE